MKSRIWIAAMVFLALAAVAVSVRGADTPVCPADDKLAAMPGLRAFIDPQTGQLRPPTPEEEQTFTAALRPQAAREREALEIVVHDDGMVSMDLKGQFLQSVVVRKAPDGSLSMGCVSGPAPAEVPRNLAPAKPAPALEEK
ncbi:MAG TPA: hypothetical protein VKH43_13245 [Thermoanaerobaculia bacterium]|nr:hypothetical protein [Thermoanaerobaculia bacterium]